jgi:hypothetical protein
VRNKEWLEETAVRNPKTREEMIICKQPVKEIFV